MAPRVSYKIIKHHNHAVTAKDNKFPRKLIDLRLPVESSVPENTASIRTVSIQVLFKS